MQPHAEEARHPGAAAVRVAAQVEAQLGLQLGAHAVALLNDGDVTAWGVNSAGQLNIPGWLTDHIESCLCLSCFTY